jgi:hypothetical protein
MQGTDRRLSGKTKVLENATYHRQLRAILAVTRKIVAYLLVVDRQQRDFLPAEESLAGAASKLPLNKTG